MVRHFGKSIDPQGEGKRNLSGKVKFSKRERSSLRLKSSSRSDPFGEKRESQTRKDLRERVDLTTLQWQKKWGV